MNNKIHDAFNQIEASDELKASTIDFLNKKRTQSRFHAPKRMVMSTFAIACVALCVFIGVGKYNALNDPISYISIDVNPSIEISLNKYNEVIEATAYNDDGKLVLDNLEVKGMECDKAIDTIVENEALMKYINEDSALTFTVASDDPAKKSEISSYIEKTNSCKKYKGNCYQSSTDEIKIAHEQGLSFGKYSAYLKLHECDDSITIDDCKSMTMAEIRTLIKKHTGSSGGDNCETGSSNGSGNGNGNVKGNNGNSNNGNWSHDGSGNGHHEENEGHE